MERTVQDGEVRELVTGGARSGEANTEPGVHTASVNEADGVSAGDVAEGGEPSESIRQALQAVWSRSGAVDCFEVQRAPR